MGRKFGCGGPHTGLFAHRYVHMLGGFAAILDRPNDQRRAADNVARGEDTARASVGEAD